MRNTLIAALFVASTVVLASCGKDDSHSFRSAKLSPLAEKAFKIAEFIALEEGNEAFEVCVTEGSFGGFPVEENEPEGSQAFNIALGGCDFDTETCDCDPHFSIDVFLNKDGEFILAQKIDA
jgi:hypothetical protein